MSEKLLPSFIRQSYDVYDFRHATAIISTEFPDLFKEICSVLETFRFSPEMVIESGGSESKIPKEFSRHLRPLGWIEGELTATVIIDDNVKVKTETHKIDYVKGKVAFDLEWNSKDQTFDRDLYAFRAFFDYFKISVGILVTRSTSLQNYFASLGSVTDRYGTTRKIKNKYGASTTHMDKLIPRLEAGRSGGCPVLALGITTALLSDED